MRVQTLFFHNRSVFNKVFPVVLWLVNKRELFRDVIDDDGRGHKDDKLILCL